MKAEIIISAENCQMMVFFVSWKVHDKKESEEYFDIVERVMESGSCSDWKLGGLKQIQRTLQRA